MYTYRRKKSLYIIFWYETRNCLTEIHYLCNKLFERATPEKLIELREKLNKLIKFVEDAPTYGKSENERKVKCSIHWEQQKIILDELKKINTSIDTTLTAGRERILKGAETLNLIQNLKKHIIDSPTYSYGNKKEIGIIIKSMNIYDNYKKLYGKN